MRMSGSQFRLHIEITWGFINCGYLGPTLKDPDLMILWGDLGIWIFFFFNSPRDSKAEPNLRCTSFGNTSLEKCTLTPPPQLPRLG